MKNLYIILFYFLFFPLKIFSQESLSEKSFHFADSLFIKNLDLKSGKVYIDSAIYYAKQTKSKKQLAYIYSSIGFFFNKKEAFDKSLFYFKKSNDYAQIINDLYIINSNYYSVSLIYFQLGNINESKNYLLKSFDFFIKNQETQSNRLALLNILNRLVIIEIINKNLNKAKLYNNLEFTYSKDSIISKEFHHMHSLPMKNKGIILYEEGKYIESVNYLNKSIYELRKNNINYWLTIVYSYIGKNYLALKDHKKSYIYFTKVDSIFKEKKMTDPLIRNGLENLNSLNKKYYSINKQLESINTLIEFDSLYKIRNINLSNEFYGNFINNELQDEKKILEERILFKDKFNMFIIVFFLILCIVFSVFFLNNRKKNKKQKLKFQEVIDFYIDEIRNLKKENKEALGIPLKQVSENLIDESIINNILIGLDILEKENFFLDIDTSLNNTANKLKTNTNYLSAVINTKKGMNFPSYINKLRINFIIKEIIENKRIRSMSMDGIANTAGFKTRQKFSDSFLEITGIRPSYFITNIEKIDMKNKGLKK